MHILSLGLGVQSTALYYMSALGQIARFDAAVFADTGAERSATLDYLQRVLLPWADAHAGPPILIMNKRNLAVDLRTLEGRSRFASIPAYTRNPDGSIGMLRRQCTNEYKITQVNAGIRQLHQLRPHKHTPPTTVAIGITIDELGRINSPDRLWKTHYYPFVGYRVNAGIVQRCAGLNMSRQDVSAWYTRTGIEEPPKSGCYMCPFQSDSSWKRMKQENQTDWLQAVEIDRAIRNASTAGVTAPLFLHSTAQPLEDVTFGQGELFEECSGYCHS